MQPNSHTQQNSTLSSNAASTKAMELLNSIKKQRELFSQTLSTAQMPSQLRLDEDEFNLNPVAHELSKRQPLSPRNKTTPERNDARELECSLRSKREYLIKRFEQANLTQKATPPSLLGPTRIRTSTSDSSEFGSDQENDLHIGKKVVVDTSMLEDSEESESLSGYSYSLSSVRNSLKKVSGGLDDRKQDNGRRQSTDAPWVRDGKEQSVAGYTKEDSTEQMDANRPPWAKKVTLNKPKQEDTMTKKKAVVDMSWIKQDDEKQNDDAQEANAGSSISNLKQGVDKSWIKKASPSDQSPATKSKLVASLQKNYENDVSPSDQSPATKSKLVISLQKNYENDAKDRATGILSSNNRKSTIGDVSWMKKEPLEVSNDSNLKKSAALDGKSWIKETAEGDGTKSLLKTTGRDLSERTATLETISKVPPKAFPFRNVESPETTNPQPCATSSRQKESEEMNSRDPLNNRSKVVDSSWIKKDDCPRIPKPIVYQSNNSTETNTSTESTSDSEERGFYKVELKKVNRTKSHTANANPSSWKREPSSEPRGRGRAVGRGSDRSSVQPKARKGKIPPENKLIFERTISTQYKRKDGSIVRKAISANSSGLQSVRQYWKQNEQGGNANKEIQGAIPVGDLQKERRKSQKLASIIDSMEKFSKGEALITPQDEEARDEPGCLRNTVKETPERSNLSCPEHLTESTECINDSEKTQQSVTGQPSCSEAKPDEYCFENDDGSEVNTCKFDNFQSDFGIDVPLQTSWSNPLQSTQFFGELSEQHQMEIISVVSNSPCAAPRMNETMMAFQDVEHDLGEPMFSGEQLHATSRTRYKVARYSLLSSLPPDPSNNRKRKLSVDAEADPIFQVFAEIESKPHRKFRSFLQVSSTKARDDDVSNSQEENKPSKSMFKMLKKGLSTPSAKTKETLEEVNPEDNYCDSTTISSITRSVTSGIPQKGLDTKQNLPLGVLNGIFKAAKKLQNKKKRKTNMSDRMRSLSKGPTLELPPMTEVGAGKTFFAEEPTVRNNEQYRALEPRLTAERGEYGTRAYGKLLHPPPMNAPDRTSRLGDAPSPAIYSTASW